MIDKKGNRNLNAFRSLYQDFFPVLCLFANRYLHDVQVSEDIVQDAFFYCWTKKVDMSSIPRVKNYLYKHVRNRSLNYLRDSRLIIKDDFDLRSKNDFYRDLVIEHETYQLVHKAIKSLSPQSQRVIELTLNGLKNNEIAKRLGVTINTVKTTKRRAFHALRHELKENVFALLCIFQQSNFDLITAGCSTYSKDFK